MLPRTLRSRTTDAPAPPTTEVIPTSAPDPDPGAGTLPDDTGPELQWIEVATDVRVPPGQLMWTGSSFLIISAGLAGLAVYGWFSAEPGAEEPSEILIEKDGYRMTMTNDNETIVIEVETGTTVLYLGPEDDVSEFVIEDENGYTLLHRETLEPLVSITGRELEQAFEEAYDASYTEPEFFIGWSGDGERWGWQTTSEAFGANGGAQLAVGDDAVVAMFHGFDSDGSAVRMFATQIG